MQSASIIATSSPQALPNDGYSEATVTVEVTDAGQPQPGQVVRGSVIRGGGLLVYSEVTTDANGVAAFPFRAGLRPEATQLSFSCQSIEADTALDIPLAAVTYLDVTLVTPEEYKAHLARQAAAAPIYSLALSSFPEQLAADGGSMSTISATLSQSDGKPAAGVPLLAQVVSGEGDVLAAQQATDSAGRLRFYFIAGFQPGTASVQVIEPSTGLIKAVDIVLVEAGPARVQLFYSDPLNPAGARDGALLPADGTSELDLVAEVTDLTGIPLSGVELKLEVFQGENGWVSVLDPVTDAEGHVEFSYHSGMHTGAVRIRAFIASGLHYELNRF